MFSLHCDLVYFVYIYGQPDRPLYSYMVRQTDYLHYARVSMKPRDYHA